MLGSTENDGGDSLVAAKTLSFSKVLMLSPPVGYVVPYCPYSCFARAIHGASFCLGEDVLMDAKVSFSNALDDVPCMLIS